MAKVTLTMRAAAEQVYAILADGWTYSDWVVGTAHIRDVDASWPEPGSQLHHKVGPWPLSIKNTSTVTALTPGRGLALRAGVWPFGEAVVRITLEPINAGETRVTMYEDFQAGPLHWLRNKINDLALHGRNVEALRRLAELAEHSRHTTHSRR
ncbi:SRPBCC family protein [Actinoplanes hulinensis]|uniref:SRPBCC family protein n=1 Tax=Actinoplanes hulinensis TaxID=1144547 RepID=A0ABS7BG01_9ACTN|nr:SRPBCC family protein [Actinoplanes hulinensis]MBW6439799.1 SRPBCC family protein [Actinoplanes hulinensis]